MRLLAGVFCRPAILNESQSEEGGIFFKRFVPLTSCQNGNNCGNLLRLVYDLHRYDDVYECMSSWIDAMIRHK